MRHSLAPFAVLGQKQIGDSLPAVQILQTCRRETTRIRKGGRPRRDLASKASRNCASSSRISLCSDSSKSLRRIPSGVPQPLIALSSIWLMSWSLSLEIVIQMKQQIGEPGMPVLHMSQSVSGRFAIQVLGILRNLGHAPKRDSQGMRRVIDAHKASMVSMRSRAGFPSRPHPGSALEPELSRDIVGWQLVFRLRRTPAGPPAGLRPPATASRPPLYG